MKNSVRRTARNGQRRVRTRGVRTGRAMERTDAIMRATATYGDSGLFDALDTGAGVLTACFL
jgi:hypothetical protein